MPILKPLRAIRYTERAGELSDLACPPYDVISPAQQNALYARSPYNCVRLELTRSDAGDTSAADRYERAAATYAEWLQRGILHQDAAPGFYLYRQTFEVAGKRYTRRGVIGALGLEPLGDRVKPHEKTLAKAKEDRLHLLRAIRTNISPVFTLFRDPGDTLLETLFSSVQEAPQAFTDDDNVTHELFVVTDRELIRQFEAGIEPRTVYIADGHHRYEVGLEYARECRAAHGGASGPWDYIMTMLVNMDAKGLSILPTHRLVKAGSPPLSPSDLEGDFTIRPADILTLEKLARGEMNPKAIGWFDGSEYRVLIPKLPEIAERDASPGESPARRHLAVSVLHNTILRRRLGIDTHVPEGQNRIQYVVPVSEAIRLTANGDFAHSFFLAPTTMAEVCTVAESGDVMPQKSTFFYPKLVSGFLFNPLST